MDVGVGTFLTCYSRTGINDRMMAERHLGASVRGPSLYWACWPTVPLSYVAKLGADLEWVGERKRVAMHDIELTASNCLNW